MAQFCVFHLVSDMRYLADGEFTGSLCVLFFFCMLHCPCQA